MVARPLKMGEKVGGGDLLSLGAGLAFGVVGCELTGMPGNDLAPDVNRPGRARSGRAGSGGSTAPHQGRGQQQPCGTSSEEHRLNLMAG
jgi:hypothetical protein